MKDQFEQEKRYLRAEKKLKEVKAFYWHLFWYIVINVFILIMIYTNMDNQSRFFTLAHFSTPIFWGIGLFLHWLSVFGKNIFFTKDWEQRKIKEFMDKDNEGDL